MLAWAEFNIEAVVFEPLLDCLMLGEFCESHGSAYLEVATERVRLFLVIWIEVCKHFVFVNGKDLLLICEAGDVLFE